MSRALGTLRIDLVALTGKFVSNFNSAATTLQRFAVTATKVGHVAQGAISRMSGAFSSIKNTVLSVQSILTGVVAIVGGARLAGAFDDAAESVDALGKKARIVGLSVEQMSVLRLAAGESGVEFDSLAKLVGKATKNIGSFVSTGGGPAADAINRLGVNVRSASGGMRGMNELLPEIAKAFESITDEGERLSISEAIFGREGGSQFIQWLEDSGGFMANLAEQTERATKLGVLFTERQFSRLKAYRDAVGRISEAWLGLRVRVMTELAPALENLANRLALSLARVGDFSANLASVIVAGFEKRDVLKTDGEPDLNVAFQSVKNLLTLFFDSLWVEVSSRIGYFFTRVWETVRLVMIDLFGKAGEWLGNAFATTGGFVSDAIAEIASVLGKALSAIAESLVDVGDFLGEKWREAGANLQEYGAELEELRGRHWDTFQGAIDNIDRLGKKYREAREAEEGFGKETAKTGQVFAAAAKQIDEFFLGMKQSWKDLNDEVRDVATVGRNVFGTFVRGISSGLASALASGETSFRNFGRAALSVLTDVGKAISEMLLQWIFARAIVGAFGGILGPATTAPGGGVPDLAGPSVPTFAKRGGVFGFASGGIASGVLSGPTAFNFSKKVGVAGEAGDEVGFAPLRKIGGELGVKASGGGTVVQIIDQRRSGAKAEVSEGSGTDGRKFIRVMIRDEVRRGIGEGEYDRALGGAFGLNRRGTKR